MKQKRTGQSPVKMTGVIALIFFSIIAVVLGIVIETISKDQYTVYSDFDQFTLTENGTHTTQYDNIQTGEVVVLNITTLVRDQNYTVSSDGSSITLLHALSGEGNITYDYVTDDYLSSSSTVRTIARFFTTLAMLGILITVVIMFNKSKKRV